MLDINAEYFYPMKTISTLICIFSVVSAANATTHTVSNNGFPAQFINLTTAIAAASIGDTLNIAASGLSYGSITLAKSLTLIGEVAWPATGESASLDRLILNPGAEGAKIMGLNIVSAGNFSVVEVNCDNVLVERCRIRNVANLFGGVSIAPVNVIGSHQGFTLRHSYIALAVTNYTGTAPVINLNNMNTVLITNNVIYGSSAANSVGYLSNSNSPTVTIANNLFISESGSAHALASTVNNTIVTNNIFWGPGARVHGSVTGCVFNNNLTWENGGGAMPPPNNSGIGNLVSTNPQFVNAPNRTLTNTYNYTPQLAAAVTGGTDGTAIGIMGGSLPWPNNFGYPRLPRVTAITLVNGTIPQGGNLNVTSDGTKVD